MSFTGVLGTSASMPGRPIATAPVLTTTNGKVDVITVSLNPAGSGYETILSYGNL